MLERLVLMSLHFVLVAHDLSIELIDEKVDRRVHVAVRAFHEDVLAFQMKAHFNLLSLILFPMVVDREDNIAIDYLIKMP